MKDFNELLTERESKLTRIINKCVRALSKAPEGTLRAVTVRGKPRYYHCTEKGDHTGKYINSGNLQLARRLAQRDYYKAALKAAARELEAIRYLIDVRASGLAEDCFEKLKDARKVLVRPVTLSDEEYAKKWQETPYEGKKFKPGDPEHFSLKGERMRSKSEVIIANLLYSLGIPYKYECPLKLDNGVIIHPDFTILNKRTREVFILEHLGMMGDEQYAADNTRKFNELVLSGYIPGVNLIISFETDTTPLNIPSLEAQLRALVM